MASRTPGSRYPDKPGATIARPGFIESLEGRTLLSTYSLQTLVALGGNSGIATANSALLVTSNDTVYGTTPRGGVDLSGSIFALPKGQSKFTTLGYFTGLHGADPEGGLVMDSAGDLFGTTVYTTSGKTGNYSRPTGVFGAGNGTLFELPKGSSIITTLATFNGTDGQSPEGTLVIDAGGNLYGTTRSGGASGDGTVFELPAGSGTITTLASFDGTNGSNPISPLLLDPAGNLFGVTPTGGANSDGTIFEIPAGGTLTTLVSFNGTNGAAPSSGLVEDASGNLFGNAGTGGANNEGAVYELPSGSNAITAITSFSGTDGSDPQGQLGIDASGDLFGTAHLNGAANDGTVFEIAAGTNTLTVIAAFNVANGSLPDGLSPDGNGNFYAITGTGGTYRVGTLDRLLEGGTANTPGQLTAVMGQTTLPPAVVGGAIVDSTVTVGLTDALSVDGPVTLRLYASANGVIDSSSTLIRTFAAQENIKAGVQFAINLPIQSLPTTLPTGFYRLLVQAADPVGNIATTDAGPGVEVAAPAVSFGASFTQVTLPAQSLSGTSTPARAYIQLSNTGNIPSQGLLHIILYFSPDGSLSDAVAIRSTGRFPYILPGGVIAFSVPLLDIPPGLGGDYYLVAQLSGRTGATTTIVSNSTYSILPGAAAMSATINAFDPQTVNPNSSAPSSITVTLSNTGNLPAGGAADPFMLTLGLASPDGTQTVSLESFTSAVLLNPGQSRTVKLTFKQNLLAGVASGTWLPTITVSAIAGSPTTVATSAIAISVQ